MNISEKAADLKGYADGLGINEETNEGKVIVKLLELVEDMADKIDLLEQANEELYAYIEEIDDDLSNLEEDLDAEDYEEDYSDLNDDEDFDFDEDEDYYEIECASCGEKICFTDDIQIEELVCPACGELVVGTDGIGCDMNCDACSGCDEE